MGDSKKNKFFLKDYDLKRKIDEYIIWYFEEFIYIDLKDMRQEFLKFKKKVYNFIEKMAVWYELRFPSDVLNRLISLDKDELLTKGNIYDYITFFKNLSINEQLFIINPEFPGILYLDNTNYINLSSDGIIKDCVDSFTLGKQSIGENVKLLQAKLKQKGIIYPNLDREILKYETNMYAYREFFNCVMYMIIEREDIDGARRAFLFAKEFNLNIDIPIMYAIHEDDVYYGLHSGTKKLIDEYLKLGGSEDLNCVIKYNPILSSFGKMELINLKQLLKSNIDSNLNDEPSEKRLNKKL